MHRPGVYIYLAQRASAPRAYRSVLWQPTRLEQWKVSSQHAKRNLVSSQPRGDRQVCMCQRASYAAMWHNKSTLLRARVAAEHYAVLAQVCGRQQGMRPYAAATTSVPSAPPRYSTGQPAGGAKYGGRTVVITGGSQVQAGFATAVAGECLVGVVDEP